MGGGQKHPQPSSSPLADAKRRRWWENYLRIWQRLFQKAEKSIISVCGGIFLAHLEKFWPFFLQNTAPPKRFPYRIRYQGRQGGLQSGRFLPWPKAPRIFYPKNFQNRLKYPEASFWGLCVFWDQQPYAKARQNMHIYVCTNKFASIYTQT